MNFERASKLGNYLSKSFARDIFELLVSYNSISASEAASRLELHIQTVQEFLEALSDLDILIKKQVTERKRPYFRYSLQNSQVKINIDLIKEFSCRSEWLDKLQIREKKNAGIHFALARNGKYFSSITLWLGAGRNRKEKKISLTIHQGLFLYNLPFPDGEAKSIEEIMNIASIPTQNLPEIKNLINELIQHKVIEYK